MNRTFPTAGRKGILTPLSFSYGYLLGFLSFASFHSVCFFLWTFETCEKSFAVFKGEKNSSVSFVSCHLGTLDFAVQTHFVFYCLCHLLAESRPCRITGELQISYCIYTESAHWSFWMQSSLVVLNTCDSNLCQHMNCQVCEVSRMLLSFKPGTSAKMLLEELKAPQINRFGLTLKGLSQALNSTFWLTLVISSFCVSLSASEGPNLCIKMFFYHSIITT